MAKRTKKAGEQDQTETPVDSVGPCEFDPSQMDGGAVDFKPEVQLDQDAQPKVEEPEPEAPPVSKFWPQPRRRMIQRTHPKRIYKGVFFAQDKPVTLPEAFDDYDVQTMLSWGWEVY